MSTSHRKRQARKRSNNAQSVTSTASASSLNTLITPLLLTAGLLLVSFVPRIQANDTLAYSFAGAGLSLGAWQLWLHLKSRKTGAQFSFDVVMRPQHYVQAAVQLSVFVYWGWFWRPVYDHGWLLLGQVLFAYAFDILLSCTRRHKFILGFGPFPIIFSTNLFLWFRDDWFYLQFLMIAVGFLGKEFVHWERYGKRVHIFNPSAFSLGLFSLALIASGTTSLTWGEDIATTLTLAPYIYLFLFLIGLVVMYFFSITLIAGSAALVLFSLSALYSASTGVPYFIDSEIPTAVFLGLHLLVTDPSTSPRSPLGKTLFGVIYGLTVFLLYTALGAFGIPTFYDKLLSVPLLNLCVRWIDRVIAKITSRNTFGLLAERLTRPTANLAHMSLWIVFFATMTIAGATDGQHRGDTVPFWEQACHENRPQACERLLQIESSYCGDASAWACNELGRHYSDGISVSTDLELALTYFSRACELRFQAACLNVVNPNQSKRANPKPLDLRLLLREGGSNLMSMPENDLYVRACRHNWTFACNRGRPQ